MNNLFLSILGFVLLISGLGYLIIIDWKALIGLGLFLIGKYLLTTNDSNNYPIPE